MTFAEFSYLCRIEGLTAKLRTETHWQIYSGVGGLGRLLVDVWPVKVPKWRPAVGYSGETYKATRGTPAGAVQWAADNVGKIEKRTPAMQPPVAEQVKERIPLGEPIRNIKVFRGSHGKNGESAQLRRACDYLNGQYMSSHGCITPDTLAAALAAEPSAAEYRDALRGLLDLQREELHPTEAGYHEVQRARELLTASSEWTGSAPPAAGDTIGIKGTRVGEIYCAPATVTPAKSKQPETEEQYRKRTRARIGELLGVVRALLPMATLEAGDGSPEVLRARKALGTVPAGKFDNEL